MFSVESTKLEVMMKIMHKISATLACVAIVWLWCCAQAIAVTSTPQIFLIQNSGWMLPFYDDPNSQLKPLITELTARIKAYGGEEQVIASFNQSAGDNISPKLLYRGNDQSKVKKAVQLIEPARKPGRKSYADTDFQEAIVGAITKYSPGVSCLIWIITNNKNSPDNSQETVERNKEFYDFVQNSKEIQRIVAFPVPMQVQSRSKPDFKGNGLMIYAMAYGDQADNLLQQMVSSNAPFGSRPARLKPLNAEALTFLPTSVKGNDSIKVSIANQHTLVLSFTAAGKPEAVEITGQFRNDFFPFDLRKAGITFSSSFQSDKEGISSSLSTDKLVNIPAEGLSEEVSVKISIPSIPSFWNPEVIFGSGYRVPGRLQFELKDQQLEISKEFVKSMSELFPKDPLPELFVPGESAKNSITVQPLLIQVEYPAWPMFVIGGGIILLSIALLLLMLLFRSEKRYRVSVDGVQKSYGIRPLGSVVIMNASGVRVGIIRRGLGKPNVIRDKGKECNVRLM